jgi:hypothetical protein
MIVNVDSKVKLLRRQELNNDVKNSSGVSL